MLARFGPVRLLAAALALAPGAGTAAAEVSFDATASLALTSLPGPRDGGRELSHAFGTAAGEVILQEIGSELRDLKAFRDIVPDGGDYRLDLRIDRVSQEFRDLRVAGPGRSSLTVILEARAAWTGVGGVVAETDLDLKESRSLDEPPTKRELQDALRALVRESGRRALAELYERRGPGRNGEGGGRAP